MANNTFNIPKIPIVGGPCSGKSTGLVHINEKLTSLGFTPLFVPESATILFNSGLSQSRVGSNYLFQSMLFDYQIQNEIYFDKQASLLGHSGKKSIIILDRSLIDGKAYCTPQIWQQILDERNIKESELYNRYNALIHLDTAPREFYTTENNIRRKDSYEEACALTEQTKQVYVGASHLSMITNRGNFKTKMFDIVSELLRIIGYPKPIEIKKKYVLTGNFTLNDFPDDVPFFVSNIQQYYVLSEDKNLITHVRKRSFNNGMTL
jgi:predicted ATPase